MADSEARGVIKVVCRTMHGPDNEVLAFAPMPLHIVFEKLIGFKPHELLFMKTSAAIIQNQQDGDKLRVRVQEPEIDGELYVANCEKERHMSLTDVLRGKDVMDCVIIGVNMTFFSVGVGNRRWMMEMHRTSLQAAHQGAPSPGNRLVAQPLAKAPADSVVRPRLCSLPWFKNISINEAKEVWLLCSCVIYILIRLYDVSNDQAAKLLAENRYLACPDVLVSKFMDAVKHASDHRDSRSTPAFCCSCHSLPGLSPNST